ncbi:DEAD/DEAH box helicase [Candidatus Bipolaricaulota bacterium]|nr:DEAD/DEAH box helicase [Candidatus Bipolaricaulota bacterium]
MRVKQGTVTPPSDPLALFSPVAARWFRRALGRPTPAQELGWPAIAAGSHTLILAPTGSGKTLAAFLFAIDELLRRPPEPSLPAVHTLYISPLKALGYDIERNLRVPLAGIQEVARAERTTFPEIRVGVRTGDTPSAERQRLVRRPPHILITTPESLHLMLTSPRARETLTGVRYVIVDEVHALAESKRGTFLSVLLERLEALCARPFQRIGLSATIRPLTEVARFLGGYTEEGGAYRERAVKAVDAGLRKELDLLVIAPTADMTALPEGSVWPSIYARLHELILAHRSTIVFVNNRRTAERVAAELNELAGCELVQVHHGSVAKERRRELEEKLKRGELPAIVATASLELGIDMGLVDLVIQVESPHGVARALQRVGRAGHLYRAPSRGRLVPKTRGDLLEMAALARAMRRAEIAEARIPKGCLDILAQQIVAIVAGGPTAVDDLLRLVRRAYPFQDLPRDAFLSVLRMLSEGALPWGARPRLVWDRVHDVLHPLPGSRHLALTSGGAIPDTGEYPVYTEGGERIGELDEEFVYEARVGEVIVLGTNRWRIREIGHDRVVVAPGDGPAKIPFWKGEAYGRDVHLGRQVGELAREIEERLGDPDLVPWLREECALDQAAAENLVRFVADQHSRSAVPTDRRAVIEGFPDEAGGFRLALLTPLGSRFHLALRLAILARFRKELGIQPDSLHGNGGILFRLTQVPFDRAVALIRGIRPEEAEPLVLAELASSPLFGLRFRENASRALLLPQDRPGKRTPLWLRRLTARDLLEAARARPGFPIVVETYREILSEFLPIDALLDWLRAVETGEVEFVVRRALAPSPFSASLLWEFQAAYLYQWDEPKPGPVPIGLAEEELAVLARRDLAHAIDPEAVAQVEGELRGIGEGRWARTGAELVAHVKRLGDVGEDELALIASPEAGGAGPGFLATGTLARVEFLGADPPERIVAGEDLPLYRSALAGDREAQAEVVRRHAGSRALVSLPELRRRYPFPAETIEAALAGPPFVAVTWRGERCWTRRETLERLRRLTLAARRGRARAYGPAALQGLVLRHQHRTPGTRLSGPEGVAQVLRELQGIALPWAQWDGEALPARVEGYRTGWVEDLLRSGEYLWLGRPGAGRDLAAAFARRDDLPWLAKAYPPSADAVLSPEAEALRAALAARGASFLVELAGDLGIPAARCAALLWELARAGLVTNDGLGPLQAGPPPREVSKTRVWQGGSGRWSLVPPPAGELTEEEQGKLAQLLLARYGILSRQTLALDGAAVAWGELYPLLTRLEWRGELERGLLVEGLAGAQFALDAALADLARSEEDWMLIPASDPAVLYGAGAPFPVPHPTDPEWRLRRGPGTFLVLRGGLPVLVGEGWGERLIGLTELRAHELAKALALLPGLVEGPVRRLTVRTWNGQPVLGTPLEEVLRGLGFQRGPNALILYRRYGRP